MPASVLRPRFCGVRVRVRMGRTRPRNIPVPISSIQPAPARTFPVLEEVLHLLLDAVCVVDADGRFVFISEAGERIFGYRAEEMIGRPMIEFVFPEDRQRTLDAASEVQAGRPNPHFQNRYVCKNGRVAHIMWSARWSEDHRVRIAVARDITLLKRAETLQAALYAISEAAHLSEDLVALFRRVHQIVDELLPAPQFLVALIEPLSGVLSFPYRANTQGSALSPASTETTELAAEIVRSGQAVLINRPRRRSPNPAEEFRACLGVPLRSKTGMIGALLVASGSGALSYSDDDRELLEFVSIQIATAIERKQSENRLRYIARHDTLTGLANREYFRECFQAALQRAGGERATVALLYIDLDGFKEVNDTFGHVSGDLLLRQVAERLRSNLRDSDLLGRIGGDEFLVLLEGLEWLEQAAALAEQLRGKLDEPFELAGQRVRVSASIGVAHYPQHGDSADDLARQADAAMYSAKALGGNRILVAG